MKIFKILLIAVSIISFIFLFKSISYAIPYCAPADGARQTYTRYNCRTAPGTPLNRMCERYTDTTVPDCGNYFNGGYCGDCIPRSQTGCTGHIYTDPYTKQTERWCTYTWARKNTLPNGSPACSSTQNYYHCGSATEDECNKNSDCSNNNTCIRPAASDSTCEPRYGNCNQNTGDCSKVVGGSYSNLTTCNNNCDVDECDRNSDCSNNNTCINPAANNSTCEARYSCNGSTGSCGKVVGGSYANQNTCNNNCSLSCTYPSNSWSNLSCGAGNCANNQMRQVNTGSPTACTDTYRCQNDSAGSWTAGACGTSPCGANQRKYTRTVTNGCQYSTYECRNDNSCGNFNIGGRVYVEHGGNSSYQPSDDTLLNNVDVYRSNRNSNTIIRDSAHRANTGNNGIYNFPGLQAGTYAISAEPDSCDYEERTTNPATFTVGPNENSADFGFNPETYSISGYVYVDEGNGNFGGGDSAWNGNARVYNPNGGTAGTDNTNSNGFYSVTGLNPNTYSQGLLNLSSEYEVVKARINGNERTCGNGGLNCATAIQSSINASCGNVTVDWLLAAKYDISGTVYIDSNNNHAIDAGDARYRGGATLTVQGSSPVRSASSSTAAGNNGGTYTITNNPSGTHQVALSNIGNYTPDPNHLSPKSVTITNSDVTLNFLVNLPTYTISGNVFIDDGAGGGTANDGIKNGGEANVPDSISISGTDGSGNAILSCPRGPGGADECISTGAGAGGTGRYVVDKLRTTENSVSLSYSPSSLYYAVWPSPPNMAGLNIGGANCFPNGTFAARGATCSGGDINNLNFAVRTAQAWIQTLGADIRWNGSYNNQQPPNTYNSAPLAGKADAGIIYMSGNSSAPFGQGSASTRGWNVRNQPYPSSTRYIRTSYDSYASRAQRNETPIPMTDANFCASGTLANGCVPRANLVKGVYTYTGNLSLGSTTPGASYTFGTSCTSTSPSTACTYTILVRGNVTINSELKSPRANRTVLILAASGNVSVSPNIGTLTHSDQTTTHLEGVFSADNFFNTGSGNRRLNVAGAVIGNADGVAGGGGINQQRDLLAENINYPAFTVIERSDFVINYPKELKEPSFNWTELAPN